MENLLLGPRARRAILACTYTDPAREYHLRELVRLTGLAPRSVQQEIERLVAAELLAERRYGNRRYLRANSHHPLFRPVQEIVLKTDGLADVLRKALAGAPIEWAVVYGSIAGGTATGGSDIDLLVVGSVSLREAVSRLRTAQDTLGREIVPMVWTPARGRRADRSGDGARTARTNVVALAGSATAALTSATPSNKRPQISDRARPRRRRAAASRRRET